MISFVVRLKSRAHFIVKSDVIAKNATFLGARASRRKEARQRLGILIAGFLVVYVVVGARLVQYGLADPAVTGAIPASTVASRPDIVDRNGALLATDLNMISLYADPRRIVDADEVVEKLAFVIPNLDWSETYKKLRSQTAFQWLKRQLTPKQQADILGLGIPGIGFRPEKRRFYPGEQPPLISSAM